MSIRLARTHQVRQLCICPDCRQPGYRPDMISDPQGMSAGTYHPRCVLDAIGFDAVLNLPPADRGLFSIADLGVERSRLLLRSMEVIPAQVGGDTMDLDLVLVTHQAQESANAIPMAADTAVSPPALRGAIGHYLSCSLNDWRQRGLSLLPLAFSGTRLLPGRHTAGSVKSAMANPLSGWLMARVSRRLRQGIGSLAR